MSTTPNSPEQPKHSPETPQQPASNQSFWRGRMQHREPSGEPRSRWLLWGVVALIAIGLISSDWYGLALLTYHSARLNALDEVQSQVAELRDSFTNSQSQVSTVSGDVAQMDGRFASIESKLAASVAKVQQGAKNLGDSLRAEMRAMIGAQQQANEARFEELAQSQQASNQRTAELEQQLTQMNRHMAALDSNLTSAQNSAAVDTAQLRRELYQTNAEVARVADSTVRPRQSFELAVGASKEIAPNIRLHISGVNPAKRQFTGWVQLVDEGKFIWLRDENAMRSVSFYAGDTKMHHELLVTDLTSGGVVGYLIMPSPGEQPQREYMSSAATPDSLP